MERRRCTGAILAGGRSTRFGGAPKGLAPIAGIRMVDRVKAALAEATDQVVMLANDAAAGSWLPGLPVVRDLREGSGALGGLHAALVHAQGDVLVAPWDSPFVTGGLLRSLREAGELVDADAAVPVNTRSPWGFEPLCAWYTRACLGAVERSLDAGDFRAGAWQAAVNTLHVDVSAWGDARVLFFNVNTAEDLMHAEELMRSAARS